jgi:hypothetical protein
MHRRRSAWTVTSVSVSQWALKVEGSQQEQGPIRHRIELFTRLRT